MAQRRTERSRKSTPRPRPRTATSAKKPAGGSRKPRPRRIARTLGITALLVVLAVAVTAGVVYAAMARELPDPDLTLARGRDQSTTITDRNGKLLVRLFAEENRQDIPLSEMPAHLKQAIVATEDKRFYAHEGVDPIGIARALVVDIVRGEKAQGGSTITQQYVKQAFVSSEKTLKRKLQEAILAQRVEKRFSKDEILELYLNTIYFGHGAYGVESASRVYFGKSVKKLTLPEAALLAGVVKSPARYSPYLEPENALARRDTILGLMLAQGYITEDEAQAARSSEIELTGLKARTTVAPYFVEWVKEQLVKEFGERMVYRGGLTVKTTLDVTAQKVAQKAVKDALDKKDDPSVALVAVRPGTGEVLAMVGGRDFKKQQFNVAVQGRRQPGSAFKPFVLVTALNEGVSPEAPFASGPIKIPVNTGTWSVTGVKGAGKTPMRLRTATEKSINAVFAQLIMDVGPDKVVEMAKTLGISSKVEAVPAIALGGLTTGVSPLEMAGAYATLAAGGTHAEPYSIQEVTDASGAVIQEAKIKKVKALDPKVAYLTTDMLTGVIKRGTGTAAAIGRPAAGKTGTTQQYRDAWFVGYTPELATAVWVGYPEAQRAMTSVHGIRVTGGSFPARIWAAFMKGALKNVDASKFERPDGLTTKRLCAQTGGTVTPFCPDPFKALVLPSSLIDPCTAHVAPLEVDVPDIVGGSKEDALAKLESLGLSADVTERDVEGVATGIVAEQRPAPGTPLKPGDTVSIVVSARTESNTAPVAAFTPPANVKSGKQVKLDGGDSTDDGTIATYLWEFGDGATATGRTVTHTWAAAGTFEVTLWVTDDSGAQASVTHRISVR